MLVGMAVWGFEGGQRSLALAKSAYKSSGADGPLCSNYVSVSAATLRFYGSIRTESNYC